MYKTKTINKTTVEVNSAYIKTLYYGRNNQNENDVIVKESSKTEPKIKVSQTSRKVTTSAIPVSTTPETTTTSTTTTSTTTSTSKPMSTTTAGTTTKSVKITEKNQVDFIFKEEHVPVSPDGFNRTFIGLEGLPIVNGSYTSPNEVRHLALIIPFRDGPEKVREEQLYVFLHHTIQYLVQQNSSFTIVLSNQSGGAILTLRMD